MHPDNVEEEMGPQPEQSAPPPVDKRFFIPDCDYMVMWKDIHDEYARTTKVKHVDNSEGGELVEEDLSETTADKEDNTKDDDGDDLHVPFPTTAPTS